MAKLNWNQSAETHEDNRMENEMIRDWYQDYRNYLAAVAYRMLGSYTEAEDMVQDVFVRLHRVPLLDIREPKPYLTKMIVTRSLDLLKSARKRRETYVGPWLPEPDVQFIQEDIGDRLVIEETISYALLVVLERLTPGERAVFLLHESLGYGYEEMAAMLGKTAASCRKTMSRVRKKLAQELPEPSADLTRSSGLTMRFLQAAQSGKVEDLLDWLEEDSACLTDGGGIVSAAIKPLIGAKQVAAYITGLITKYSDDPVRFVPLLVNGQLGLGIMEKNEWTTIVSVEWRGDKVKQIFMVRNPHKLTRLTRALDQNQILEQ